MAGIPYVVVQRAREILAELSAAEIAAQREIKPKNLAFVAPVGMQLDLFGGEDYLAEIKALELDDMTPKAAWEFLSRLQQRLK